MTEEIIINGVDVSECCFYNNSKCDNPNGMACNCINNAVCYFKELKRLEQENRALRKANEISIEKVTVTAEAKRLKELEQENKELKETIKQYCEWLDDERESNDKLQKVYQNDHCDLLNYRSALEEIKVISDNYNLTVNKRRKQIADKINEVLK